MRIIINKAFVVFAFIITNNIIIIISALIFFFLLKFLNSQSNSYDICIALHLQVEKIDSTCTPSLLCKFVNYDQIAQLVQQAKSLSFEVCNRRWRLFRRNIFHICKTCCVRKLTYWSIIGTTEIRMSAADYARISLYIR